MDACVDVTFRKFGAGCKGTWLPSKAEPGGSWDLCERPLADDANLRLRATSMPSPCAARALLIGNEESDAISKCSCPGA